MSSSTLRLCTTDVRNMIELPKNNLLTSHRMQRSTTLCPLSFNNFFCTSALWPSIYRYIVTYAPYPIFILVHCHAFYAIYCTFFAITTSETGLLQSHSATNATQPTTVTTIPPIHGHAFDMTQLLGHSSCAKCLTVTVFFSSRLEKNGRL